MHVRIKIVQNDGKKIAVALDEEIRGELRAKGAIPIRTPFHLKLSGVVEIA